MDSPEISAAVAGLRHAVRGAPGVGRRILLGIAGAPGAGKSTFAAWLQQQFGP
ncbi:MAG: nucleoside/nucleotide kinase family protein, partial [Arthrobacter sp.]|nr:nucleoside/nucleotide kinase family protein [Arthrobacter sp.]